MNALLAAALIGGAAQAAEIATDARYALRVPAVEDRVPYAVGGTTYWQPKSFALPAGTRVLINEEGTWLDGRRFVKVWQELGYQPRTYSDGGAYGYVRLFP